MGKDTLLIVGNGFDLSMGFNIERIWGGLI